MQLGHYYVGDPKFLRIVDRAVRLLVLCYERGNTRRRNLVLAIVEKANADRLAAIEEACTPNRPILPEIAREYPFRGHLGRCDF